jgi:hypothetical protein
VKRRADALAIESYLLDLKGTKTSFKLEVGNQCLWPHADELDLPNSAERMPFSL